MLSVPIPFTSTRLDLDLPFPFLPSFPRVLLLLLLLVGTVALVVRLYRAEVRRVSRRVARVLLGLRTSAVAAIFVVFAAGPVVVRDTQHVIPGRVLIAVDVSDSMRVTDPDRPLLEKLQLARTLRLHDGVTTDEQLNDWIADVERSGEPGFPPPDTDAGAARRAMFDEVKDRAGTLTRVQAAERALGPGGADLLARLRKVHAVEVVGFGHTLTALPGDAEGPQVVLAARTPGAAFTDLKLPLAVATEGRGENTWLGVVVFTDGRHNWGEPPAALAKSLGTKGVPVFPVNVGPHEPPADVAVVAVKPAVATICRGSSVPVEVPVRVNRWPAGRIAVELKFVDGRPPLTQSVRHDGPDRTYELTFHPPFDRAGAQVLTATARPESMDPRPENNSRSARVTVVDYKPRVLLIDGEARWEFRYLRSALLRSKEPELDVKAVVFRQPRIGATPDPEAEKAGLPLLKLADDEDALTGFDCVVLGDVTDEQLPPRDRERLANYVADAGGTLVVLAGKRFLPVGLAETASEADPLRKLLPIRNTRVFAPPDGFAPEFTPEGKRARFLRLADTSERDRAIWDGFPPHEWAAVGEPKDGAEVLATASMPRVPVPVFATPPEKPAALIVRQNYGFGRVLYLGVDSTWRWRFKTGDEHHHRFWKQVVQWAAADRLLPARNAAGTIRFGTREPVYPSGQDVEFVLRATEAIPRPGPTAVKVVRLMRLADEPGKADTLVGLIPLESQDARPREVTARVRHLPPGRYAAEPELPEWADHLRAAQGPDGRPGKLRATFEVLPPESDELTELAANLPLLESLAGATGGRVFDLSEVGGLADVLTARAAVKESEVSTPLRRSWWTLAIVALLLTAAWVVRKFVGLA